MQTILKYIRRADNDFHLLEDGDKIAVALSGGKDSITLLAGLKALQRFYPKHFEIIAISINPGFEFFDVSLLQEICSKIEVPLFIEESHAKEIVFDIRKEKNPCSLCANIRRGILNSVAIKEHCNKIALGHNQDDAIETYLLNVLYTGNMSTFAPKIYMDRSQLTLIRPLIYASEKDIKGFIHRNNIEVMKKCCPMDGYSKREDMKKLVQSIGKQIPMVKENIFGAICRSSIKGWEKEF